MWKIDHRVLPAAVGAAVSILLTGAPRAEKISFTAPDTYRVKDGPAQRVLGIQDGVRVVFPDGWGLVRASNTQPMLVMRFEAESEKRLNEIRNLIESKINELNR